MPLVKAQCTNCKGTLEIDENKDTAICPYCGPALAGGIILIELGLKG